MDKTTYQRFLARRSEEWASLKPQRRKEFVLTLLRELDDPPTTTELNKILGGWNRNWLTGTEGALTLLRAEGKVIHTGPRGHGRWVVDPDISGMIVRK